MLLYFLNKHFPDKENLVTPINPVKIETDLDELAAILCEDKLNSDYRILNREIRRLGTKIPPLVNSYMGLSQTMRVFGTAVNEGFGNVEETGILIAIDEIEKSKVIRHISSFIRERYGFFLSLRKNKA